MTKYVNSRLIKHIPEYIKDKDWYRGKVIGKAGKFNLGDISHKQETIQLDKIYALGATIKKSDKRAFPSSVITDMASISRKLKWFDGIIEWTDLEHEDYIAGKDTAIEDTRVKVDNVDYQYDKDLESWFVGYGTTFTSDPDYDPLWVPWMKAASTSGSTADAPGDMNDKVTNIAGTTGTTATILDMTTVLTSTSTNMTMDFAHFTFQPVIDAFSDFEDANTGRRMVDSVAADNINVLDYQCHVKPSLARALKAAKLYDGEKIIGKTVAQDMNDMGIEIVPNREFSAALEEDGTCQFGFTASFSDNFKRGVANKMKWDPDLEVPGRNSKWLKKMTSRLVPYTQPYFDGTNWYKAFFHGTFVYKNDAA
jgi:hypothetical protein